MISDIEIKIRGMKALAEALRDVGAEKFVTLMMREPFDYTQWQTKLWCERDVDDVSRDAMKLRKGAICTASQKS